MRNSIRRVNRRLFVTTLVLIAGLTAWQVLRSGNPDYLVRRAEQKFAALDQRMQSQLTARVGREDSATSFRQEDYTLLLFVDDCLEEWTDNRPAFQALTPALIRSGTVLTLPNGRYWVRKVVKGNRTGIGLLLVRNGFPFVNHYLKNTFNPALELPQEVVEANTGIALHSPEATVLSYLDFHETSPGPVLVAGWLLVMLLMIMQGLLLIQGRLSNKRRMVFVLSVIVLRVLMIVFHVPYALYTSSLFGPSLYASNYFFNSPGDLLLNGCTLLLLVCSIPVGLFRNTAQWKKAALTVLVSAGLLAALHFLIAGTVMNGRISYDVADLSSVDTYTLVVLFSIAVYLLAGMVLVFRILSVNPLEAAGGKPLAALFVAALVTSIALFHFNALKELETRKQFLRKMALERDQVAEFLFREDASRITGDSVLAAQLTAPSMEVELLENRVRNACLGDYFSRFDVVIQPYTAAAVRRMTDPSPAAILQLFSDRRVSTKDTLSYSRLLLLPPEGGKMCYAAVVPLCGKGTDTVAYIAFKFSSRIIQTGQGFPELLVSGTLHEHRSPDKWSFARYQNGALVYEYGLFPYSFSADRFAVGGDDEFHLLKEGGLDHLFYRPNEETLLVLTAVSATPLAFITLFSWLLLIFSVLLLLVLLSYRLSLPARTRSALTRRIRSTVVALVVFSFIVTGAGTVYYIFKKYDNDQHRNISEQLNGIWILLGDEAGLGEPLSALSPVWLQSGLDKIKASTNIDYDLFDENGKLFYTTQPRLYDQGIVSDRMNTDALHQLRSFNTTQYIHHESIGALSYLSAYAPFVSSEGKPTGYLHLPYFEKQNERSREVSGFLSALLNIYVLLFALALLVTAFISSRITQPLALLQEKLAGIRFGRRNEPIVYPGNDEIGLLVDEYNRMVLELVASADKLAQSEREGAWREMARQVAHEIKNPLTPMRLSIQHLQRAWNDQSTDREAMLKKVTQTLIEQIDSLSYIATEFSNFAQMPAATPERLDVIEVVNRSISLFTGSYPGMIHLHVPEGACMVMADKEQLGRILSNLLKNAIQAVPDGHLGEIHVRLMREEHVVRIEVQDNGTGIPEALKAKIFMPNFTTKSGGTGLGLAMVKNIVDQAGGEVSFTSTEGQGTTFTIRWPLAV